ncbi:hypothetical protein [Streptomyces sp. 7N604]|uniref:hypothetical protein n=1 Tax=Streptomyces sp. 7N604 TaxID=3457415 RepID=UPI003FD0F088
MAGGTMPFFTKAVWPGDHRDEIVAGALVGAVVIVVGYASGIGGARAPGAQEAAAPPGVQPGATAPPSPGPSTGGPPPDGVPAAPPAVLPPPGSGFQVPPLTFPVDHTGHGQGGHGGSGLPGGGQGSGHDGGPGGHDGGHGTTYAPSPSDPAGDHSPGTGESPCSDGSVHLVQPLLEGVTSPVTSLFDGLLLGPGISDGATAPSPRDAEDTDDAADEARLPAMCTGLEPEATATPPADRP